MKAPLVKLQLVREAQFSYLRMTCAREIAHVVGEITAGNFDESFYAVALDAKNRIVHVYPSAKGTNSNVVVNIGDLFRAALIAGASGIATVHNHPSGDPSPSVEGRQLTVRVKQASDLLGVRYVDNIVVGENGSYWSASEKGEM